VETENSFPQRHSRMSNLPEVRSQKSGVRMKAENHKTRMSPAQRDSGMSKLGLGVLRILRSLGILGRKTKNENRPAQRDSGNSILKTSPYCPCSPYRPLDLKTTPAQRDSGISIFGRLSGLLCWPHGQNQSFSTGLRNLQFDAKSGAKDL